MKKILLLIILSFAFNGIRAGTEISSKTSFSVDLRGLLMRINEGDTEGIVAVIQRGGYVKVKLRAIGVTSSIVFQSIPVYLCQSTISSSSMEDYVADEILGEELSFNYIQNGFTVHIKSGKDILGRLQAIIPSRGTGSDYFTSIGYPNTTMNSIYTDLFRMALIPLSNYILTNYQQYYDNIQRFELEIISKDAVVKKIKIPGIGILTSFDSMHPCFNALPSDEVCDCIQTLKNAGNEKIIDVIPVAHRGSWGSNDNAGPPENSGASIRLAKTEDIKFVEVDLMMTKDKQLVCMHDYNLERLTNYGGTAYLFDKNYSEIQYLKLRNRDGSISNENILKFDDLIDIIKEQKLPLMVDIKEMQARMRNGLCIANCEYQTSEKQKESWFEILNLCYTVIQNKSAHKHIIFKTYYSPSVMISKFDQSKMKKILITPMIISNNFNNDIQLICQFVDDWILQAGVSIAYFETDFFNNSDVQLQGFYRGNKYYNNILHYLNDKGYRGGIFTEEPVGRKGVVNRWAEWKMKNTETDFRGDHLKLIKIPYATKMVMTTDRVDVWKQILKIQK